jgi:hypothetical protein
LYSIIEGALGVSLSPNKLCEPARAQFCVLFVHNDVEFIESFIVLAIESYLQIESACGPSFHPKSAQSFVFIYNGPSQYQVFRSQASSDGNEPLWPEQVTFSPQRCTDCCYLSNGDLAFHTDEDGNENWYESSEALILLSFRILCSAMNWFRLH